MKLSLRSRFMSFGAAGALSLAGIGACYSDVDDRDSAAAVSPVEATCATSSVFEGLAATCGGCHGAGTKLPLFESLERFEALLANDARYVVAGNPDESELVRILEGRGARTGRMPPTGPTFAELSAAGKTRTTIENVRCWIQQRAAFRCGADSLSVWPQELRRLTRSELEATLEQIFGVTAAKYPRALPDDVVNDGFDNQASVLGVSDVHVSRYQTVAEYVGREAVTTHRAKLVTCDPEGDPKCLETFVRKIGRRVFRRPLADDEVTRLVSLQSLADPAADRWAPFALAVEAMLQSPSFLFRVEVGEPAPDKPGMMKLTGFEVASRLSFLLWRQAPDEALLDAAEKGELATRDGVVAKARAMLADPRAAIATRDFTSQWFRIRSLATAELDAKLYPTFTKATRAAMATEMQTLVDDHVAKGNFLDVLTASYGYVTPETAAVYGVPAPAATGVSKVDWSASTERGGLLSTAGALMLTSHSNAPSAVARGLYVRDALLCDPPPPPPPGVPDLEVNADESPTDAEDRHSKDEPCKTCHMKMDPIGWGLDRFDAMGKLRSVNEVGRPVRQSGRIEGIAPADFAGAKELGVRVRSAEQQLSDCATRQLARFAYGAKEPEGADAQCAFDRLREAFQKSGYQFSELFIAVVASDEFRYRRGGL